MSMTATASELATTSEVPLPAAPDTADRARLRDMARAHFASVWRFLRALGVEPSAVDDAAQEVFLVAAGKLADIDPASEKPFLFGTAVHVARELRRKHAREELAADPDDDAFEPASSTTPEDTLDQKEERDLLMSLLEGIPEDLRTVLVLYEIEGQPLADIAALLGIPVGTATSRLRRAREKFEARLQRHQLRMRGDK